jgi:phenylpropionate dioxygenase-like ring-hydroxylating dioxygenase large terminal subunit
MLVTEVPAFRSFWYPVAFAEDLAAGPLPRRLLGEDLVVWANDQGGASAAHDRCPHRSSRLTPGWVDGGCIVCPYHGWQFGADGKAVHIPQLEPGLPIPPKAKLASVHCALRYGVVWIALDDPVLPIPDVPGDGDPAYRFVRQFDEVWAAAATRLMDNSFDPAHVAYVHQGSFGTPDNARIDAPIAERTPTGMRLRTQLEVENHLAEAQRSNGVTTARTVRTTESQFVAPFLRIMSITYPNGRHHVLVTGATPVDDTHLRLVQFAVRNDTEEDTPAADVVAFDRLVTLEDQALLEHTHPDYELDLTQNVHIKVDRGTLELRRIYREIVDGTWPPLAARSA